jgi:hypothetical protein
MKQLLALIPLLFSSFFAKAQNGGQFFENNVIRVNYIGYANGSHSFTVCNKQSCEARIRTKADQDPAVDIQVAPNSCSTVTVNRPTPAPIKFRAKAETSCPNFANPDMGWLEINTGNVALPLNEETVEYIREKKEMKVWIESNRYVVIETGNTKMYNLQIRVTGINGVQMFYHKQKIHKNAKIDLGYQQKGLAHIKVILEDGPTFFFNFKTLML